MRIKNNENLVYTIIVITIIYNNKTSCNYIPIPHVSYSSCSLSLLILNTSSLLACCLFLL